MFDVEITRRAVSPLKSRSIWKFTELTILQFQSLSQWKFYFSLYFVLFRTEFNLSFPEMWTNWGVKIPIKGQMLQFVTLHFSPAMCLLSTDQKIFGPFGILFNLSSHRRSTAGTGRGLDRGPPKTENCPSSGSEDVLLSSQRRYQIKYSWRHNLWYSQYTYSPVVKVPLIMAPTVWPNR